MLLLRVMAVEFVQLGPGIEVKEPNPGLIVHPSCELGRLTRSKQKREGGSRQAEVGGENGGSLGARELEGRERKGWREGVLMLSMAEPLDILDCMLLTASPSPLLCRLRAADLFKLDLLDFC